MVLLEHGSDCKLWLFWNVNIYMAFGLFKEGR